MARGTLDEILITDVLEHRPARPPDCRAEADALARLAAALNDPRGRALQVLADRIVAMGLAGSAGVSLRSEDDAHCTWRALSGAWHSYAGRALPRDQAPCGVVIDRNAALLFQEPGRYFPLLDVTPSVHELLMVPLNLGGEAIGAVWAASHDDRAFDREDARLLHRLAVFAAVACRLEAAADLEQARDEFGQLIDGVPLLLWRATGTGQWTWAGPQWSRLTGQATAASHGYGWLDRVHPDDRGRARRAWHLAASAEAIDVEYRIYDSDAERYRWFQTRATPVRDDRGEIVEWLGTSTDIDSLEAARKHQRTLLAELQHRVRNTLVVVRSIARRTAERTDSVDEFQMHFDGRIGAFARSQSLVTREPNGGVDLETLIAEELLAHQAHEGERLTISGPAVRLKPKIADVIGLAIHELAVNAVKYGGLSSDRGHVAISWEIEGSIAAPVLALTWRDAAPDRPAPHRAHHGFGSELIERGLVYDLDAATELAFGPDGVRCDIRLPLADRTA